MLVIAFLFAVVAVGLGFYAQANNSQQDMTVFGATWHTYTWVPAAMAAAAAALIGIGGMAWMAFRMRRLKRINAEQRNDINLYRLERANPAAAPAATPRARAQEPEREYVGRDASQPVGTGAPREPARDRKDAEHMQTFPVEAGSSR